MNLVNRAMNRVNRMNGMNRVNRVNRRIEPLERPAAVSGRTATLTGPWLAGARVSLAALALLLAAASGLAGCTRGTSGPPAEAGRDFGDLAQPLAAGADATPYLAMARAILEHRGRAAAALPPAAPGRRVFLAVWPAAPGAGVPAVATGNAATLADAVAAAADALAAKGDAGNGRIELDVATAVDGMTLDEDLEVPIASVGLDGVFAVRDDGKAGAILPGEVSLRAFFKSGSPTKLDHQKMRPVLADRAGIAETDLASTRLYRFRADTHIEPYSQPQPTPPSQPTPQPLARSGALALTRGMVDHPAQATPDLLVASARRGADYLARVMNDQGRYVYMYHPTDDRDDGSYGWLRHAGATYALLEAFEEFGTPLYLEKAERALGNLKTHLVDDAAKQGKYVVDTNDEEQQKSGGAGLALLAFAKDAAVSGRRSELETMRALARFIISQQYADGHFRANSDLEDDAGKKRKREPVYYQGEAALGLLRLYAVDPQPAYLDAARKAADWVVHVRDADVSQDNQEHDHWISYVLNDLYRVVRDDAYVEHAYKIARAILNKQHRAGNSPAPDWVGTFYEGQTTPGATRLEAYDADIALSRFAGRPDAWLLGPAQEVAASMLGQQFDPDNGYWLRNPAKAAGGVRESLFVQDVRIDYVQHSMSAWLHLARELRDPAYGKTGAPSQDPVHQGSAAL
jgi:hypothetical protein